jgi:demethylmenaquinone methyltransferase/2-methoxy-6-polyprenyl-1,4-benzoquinol methylase
MPAVVTASSSNPEAYGYLIDSLRDWPDQETLSQWIRGVGFARVAYRNLTAGIVALHRGRKPAHPTRRAVSTRRTAQKAAKQAPAAPASSDESKA